MVIIPAGQRNIAMLERFDSLYTTGNSKQAIVPAMAHCATLSLRYFLIRNGVDTELVCIVIHKPPKLKNILHSKYFAG